MVLARWTPFDLVGDSLDDLVKRTFGDFGSSLLSTRTGAGEWAPALDAQIEGETLHVRVELPGIDPDSDVEVEVENGVLRVSGERRHEQTSEGDGQGWFRREMRYGRFERRIALPDGVDADGVNATYDAGILDIAIPLPQKPRTKVKVAVGKQLEG